MRIVAGKYRHRLLTYPDDAAHIRPTKDRIREAIFSALGNIDDFVCLDLFAGSGAMGIEALSRNAKKCLFVDISPIAIKTIKGNLNSINIPTSDYEVIQNQADSFLNFTITKYDLVFLDPPYETGDYVGVIEKLFSKDLLKENAIIITESNHPLDLEKFNFRKKKDYKYGEIIVSICYK